MYSVDTSLWGFYFCGTTQKNNQKIIKSVDKTQKECII